MSRAQKSATFWGWRLHLWQTKNALKREKETWAPRQVVWVAVCRSPARTLFELWYKFLPKDSSSQAHRTWYTLHRGIAFNSTAISAIFFAISAIYTNFSEISENLNFFLQTPFPKVSYGVLTTAVLALMQGLVMSDERRWWSSWWGGVGFCCRLIF